MIFRFILGLISVVLISEVSFANCTVFDPNIIEAFELIEYGKPNELDYFLSQNNIPIDAVNFDCDELPIFAIKQNELASLKVLTKHKYFNRLSINKPINSEQEFSPFIFSLFYGDIDFIQWMKSQGGKLRPGWYTELMYAAWKNKIDVIKWLVTEGQDASYKLPGTGLDVLYYASISNSIEVIEYLISHGAEVNGVTGNESLPLCAAAEENTLEVVKYLVEKGAEVNTSDSIEGSPLVNSIYANSYEKVKYLLENGADPNLSTFGGWHSYETPLDAARGMVKNRNGDKRIIDILLDYGAKD